MDNKQIAHDIAIRLLPRALDRNPSQNEWEDLSGKTIDVNGETIGFADNVESFNVRSVVINYKELYRQILATLENKTPY
ncbi:hypothetical protein ACWEWU_09345 [Staphylococcus xylosus]